MAQDPEFRAKALKSTRDSAAAFIEDLRHIRSLLDPGYDISQGDLRRLSNVMRRLLVDNGGDLRSIAPPRIGKLMILAPDNNPYVKAGGAEGYQFFGSGGPEVRGMMFRAIVIRSAASSGKRLPFKDIDPGHLVSLQQDGFLRQPVLCHRSKWISRRSIIKFVANKASGVHSDKPSEPEEHAIAEVRHVMNYGNGTAVTVQMEAFDGRDVPIIYNPNAIDPVLWEILSAAYFLANSDEIKRLESVIHGELGINNPA